jgi:hypothetical protein
VNGDESVLVARGRVSTTQGPGSRAGAEVTLATPFGVVEYADAALELTVGPGELTLDVKQGGAAVRASVAEDAAQGTAPKPLHGPGGHLVLHGKVDAEALAGRCAEAQRAVGSGSASTAPNAGGSERARWAVAQLEARRAARLTCARARAAAGRLDGPERGRLESQLSAPRASTPSEPDSPAKAGRDAGK